MASTDIDAQVMQIGSEMVHRLDQLAHRVAPSVRANVEFYNTDQIISDDELLASCTENLRFLFGGLGAHCAA